jgi:hypothetical protein
MIASTTPSQGAICPGQQALMDRDEEHHRNHTQYLRAVFTVYWTDACPSTEIFYLAGYPLRLHPQGIADLEQEVLTTIQEWDETMRAQTAIFITYIGVMMSEQDVQDADWRMIGPPNGVSGDPAPLPTPTVPTSVPTPTIPTPTMPPM